MDRMKKIRDRAIRHPVDPENPVKEPVGVAGCSDITPADQCVLETFRADT